MMRPTCILLFDPLEFARARFESVPSTHPSSDVITSRRRRQSMNRNDDIPSEVRDFILAKVDSVPQLEALLLVSTQPGVTWTEDRFCQALYIDRASSMNLVAELLRRGWIVASADSEGYVFNKAWDPEGLFMEKLGHAYRTKLVRIATLIHSKASAAVRDFANAFDLKKE